MRGSTIPVLVAAAGASSRCPEGKLLKALGDRPLLGWLLEKLVSHPRLGPIVVVTGGHGPAVATLATGYPGVQVVENLQWATGLASSLKVGVAALPPEGGFLVALGDTPLFTLDTLEQILPSGHADRIRVPSYQGRRGHPVFFPEWTRPEWNELQGDTGAKPLMKRWAGRLVEIPVDDPGILRDFDQSCDFERPWDQVEVEEELPVESSGDEAADVTTGPYSGLQRPAAREPLPEIAVQRTAEAIA